MLRIADDVLFRLELSVVGLAVISHWLRVSRATPWLKVEWPTSWWWLVAEEMTLRLTDAGESGIGPRDVVMRCSLGGVRVQHGAARCGQNCGHLVAARRAAR
jgi:hypothetical protein